MTNWIVEYSSKSNIEKWFDKLTKEQIYSVAKEIKLLELCGFNLKMPHSKALKRGIFELRERKFGFRIYYAFHLNKIILLTAGNKNSQQNDIIKALKILGEIKMKKFNDYLNTRLSETEINKVNSQASKEYKFLKRLQEQVSYQLEEYMKKEKIGFNELARRLDFSASQLSKITKGQANITLSTLCHMFLIMEKQPILTFIKSSD